ncbi:NAD(P)-binding protein [Lophiostoma macrostomum CBS 122681]|uniref:NAD(P)-binding protein n=1 Tax=Lophiostoma macrostomum CBS 122681 TaxID=1314788 RepID=A0A6A6T1U9_9PLEO|nr:NAD(P)-binding protein [Lophiostoma macrostomum CBS 122681]
MSAPGIRTVAVVGGTGMFGGSVASSLLQDPKFRVRVTTRDVTTERARRIRDQGAEVVQADSWNADELASAFKGCWSLFLNTNSDDANFKQEIGPPEFEMGKIVIDAAIKQGIKYFVFAGLPYASKLTGGAVPILSFDNKAAISEYARHAGFRSVVDVNSAWAMEVFFMEVYGKAFGGFATVVDTDGYLTLKLPPMGGNPETTPWTSASDDYGDAVHGVFCDPEQWDGQTIWAVSQELSFQEVVDTYNDTITEALSAATKGKTKEVNGLMGYCNFVKGHFCDGEPVDQSAMKKLKAMSAAAKGRGEDEAELQTVEQFLRRRTQGIFTAS